jgi:hypothetical protein
VNKLTLVLLLMLPGCVTREQLAQSRAMALAHAESVCQGRGIAPGGSDYLKCVQEVGKNRGYALVADGQKLAFIVPQSNGGIGPERTFVPATYVPPVNCCGP